MEHRTGNRTRAEPEPPYVHAIAGNGPILLTIPHDGWATEEGGATRRESCKRDLGTLALAAALSDALRAHGTRPTLIWQSLHRRHADPNRRADAQPYAEGFQRTYEGFHARMDTEIVRLLSSHRRLACLDIHGFDDASAADLILGTRCGETCPYGTDQTFADALANRECRALGRAYRVAAWPYAYGGATTRYQGGWIVTRIAKDWGEHGVDAMQCEFNRGMRQPHMTECLARSLAAALTGIL